MAKAPGAAHRGARIVIGVTDVLAQSLDQPARVGHFESRCPGRLCRMVRGTLGYIDMVAVQAGCQCSRRDVAGCRDWNVSMGR